jgi:anti-sigma B factor antagonist
MHRATVVTMQLCASGGDRPLGPSGLRSIVGAGLDRRRSAIGAILRTDPWSPPRPNTGDDQMTSHEEPEQLTVDVDEPQPGVLVAQLTGWLDLATAPGAEIQLQELLDTRAPRSIVVDLSRTEFLGSAGVAVLLRLHRGALARGCEPPCLVGLSGTARRTLHGLGLLEMFSTADDVAAAMP